MRRGEICGLRRADVSYTSNVATVRDTKTGADRAVPLSPKAVDALKRLPARTDGLVFGVNPITLSKAFLDAARGAGIADIRFHDLRREATSRFFEAGYSMMEVASITGHKTMMMLRRYTHLDAAKLARRMRGG